MRRVVFAASFVDDADAIASYIESNFGMSRADAFIDDLDRFCALVADNPGLGRTSHGYETTLFGVVHDLNWIFFQYDDEEVRFIHIVDGRRDKPTIRL
jgi:plasmid stabilization system protein ParE